jgi:aminoglycoside phosphotransferase (APT) family kinase protein
MRALRQAGRLSASLPEPVLQFLREAHLAGPGESPAGVALAGGVSSDIWRVDLASGPLCVKGALPRLRVSQVWEAPVERNRYEYEWLKVAGNAAPGAAPRVYAERAGLFAMEFLDFPVWKSLLGQGRAEPPFAARVGAALAAIHAATAGREDIARSFPTDAIFHAIRLEPYLVATGEKHKNLQKVLNSLSERTARTKLCLVHGDVSPKNILVAPRGPVFLDAECAWYGDPAFDLAFCLNHLLLKCLWVPAAALRFLQCFDALRDSYLQGVTWEAPGGTEERTASLLPGLLLARVDGKSPVEYLTADSQKNKVREFAARFLLQPPSSLSALKQAWQKSST